MNIDYFYRIVSPHSMTSQKRIHGLFNSLEYIRNNNIEGDMIECGVWKGGNIFGILSYLKHHNMTNVNVWLYDTFGGLTKPTEKDFTNSKGYNNQQVMELWESNKIDDTTNNWCYSDFESVKTLMDSTDYPTDKIKYIIGDICETLKYDTNIPDKISLLRLDTDWYESTRVEMEILYPKVVDKGIIIIDDYGYWSGSKTAVDEYYNNNNIILEYQKLDDTGILITKK